MSDDLIARGLGATDAELGILPTLARYRVYLRDSSYALVDEITDWISLRAISRDNDVGTWAMEISRANPITSLVTKRSGIVIRRNNVTVFSGRVATEYTLTATTLRVAGYDDMALLAIRVALPTPLGPPYPDEYDVRTGVASTIMRQLVDVNLGSSARANRKIAALTLATDPLLGTTITSRGRLDPLITLLSELALTPYAGGLHFTLQQSDTVANSLVFTVTAAADRSTDARFSVELGTAQDFEDIWQAPGSNYQYVLLGDNLGANRTILEDGDDASIAESDLLIEGVTDMRGVTDTGEGNQKLAEALAGAVSSRRVTVVPFQVPSLEYVDDYSLGDLVTFVVGGVEFPAIVREVEIDLTTDRGVVITPTIGDANSTNDDRVATQIATISGRIGNIERNWNVPDDSILPVMLASIDDVSDGYIASYDAASGRFHWQGINSIAANLSITSLTATGAVQGSQLISTVAIGTAPLAVTSTTVVNNLNANYLEGHGSGDFLLKTGGTVTGQVTITPTGDQGLLLKHTAGDGTFGIGASHAADPVMVFRDASGDQTFEVGNSSSTYQAKVTGDANVTDDLVVGGDITVSGAALFNGATFEVQTDLAITGTGHDLTIANGNIDVESGTGGQIRIGAVIVNAASLDGSEELLVNGQSKLKGAVTVTTGGIDVTGSSIFQSGLSVANGLAVTTGAVTFPNTTLGFFGSGANSKQTVSGSRGGNAALQSLLSALANYGIVTDSSS